MGWGGRIGGAKPRVLPRVTERLIPGQSSSMFPDFLDKSVSPLPLPNVFLFVCLFVFSDRAIPRLLGTIITLCTRN